MIEYQRTINPLKENSFFLFGARATGKTALLKSRFSNNSLWIDMLNPSMEERLLDHPAQLSEMITAFKGTPEWIVIDEIQKAPKLLDVVHLEIESRKLKFALTGSSGFISFIIVHLSLSSLPQGNRYQRGNTQSNAHIPHS